MLLHWLSSSRARRMLTQSIQAKTDKIKVLQHLSKVWRMIICPHQMSIMVRPGLIQLLTYCRTCRCASAACRKSFHMSSPASSRTRFSSQLIRHAALRLDSQSNMHTFLSFRETRVEQKWSSTEAESPWELFKDLNVTIGTEKWFRQDSSKKPRLGLEQDYLK